MSEISSLSDEDDKTPYSDNVCCCSVATDVVVDTDPNVTFFELCRITDVNLDYDVSDSDDDLDAAYRETWYTKTLVSMNSTLDFDHILPTGKKMSLDLLIRDGDYGDIYRRRDGRCATLAVVL
jgi:hypothetical protein